MALDVQTNSGKRYGLAEQSVFDAAAADGANVIELDCESFTIPLDPTIIESPQVHGYRQMTQGDVQVHTYQVMPKFQVSMDGKQKSIDHILHAFFQKVVEGASAPYSKTFTWPTAQPDFTLIANVAAEGYLATIFERDPVAAHSIKAKNVIAESLTITLAANGRIKVVVGFVGLGYPLSSTPSGTWTRTAYEYYYAANLARYRVNFGAGVQNLSIKNVELALTQEIVGVGVNGTGNYQAIGILNRAGTFKMQCVKDANLLTARTNLAAGTVVSCNTGIGNATPGTVDGDFDMSFNGKLIKAPYDNEALLGMTLEGRVLMGDDGTVTPTIIMANNIDRGW